MNCVGQDDWMNVVPGRHVNQFIGDIRAAGAAVNITDYTVSENTYKNRNDHYKFRSGWSSTTIEIIGCAYVIDKIGGNDAVGTVKVKKKGSNTTTNVGIMTIL